MNAPAKKRAAKTDALWSLLDTVADGHTVLADESPAHAKRAQEELETILAEGLETSRLLSEARAEVERLTRERDEAKKLAEDYRRKGEADWNACCDVLIWTRRFDDTLPPPSRAVAAVCERLAELDSTLADQRGMFATHRPDHEPMIPASHAEKVLVAVAKEAAKVGAEDMREKLAARFMNLAADAVGAARQPDVASNYENTMAWEWTRIAFERCASEAKNWRPKESP